MNGSIGLVIGSFERSFRPRVGVGSMVEETVGQGTAEALVEKEEQKRDFDAFLGEAIGVVVSVASEELVGLHFTQVIAELIEPVTIGRKMKAGKHGLVDLGGPPTSHLSSAMQENFHLT